MKDSFWEILGRRRLSDFGTFWICILKPIFFIIVTITEIKKNIYIFLSCTKLLAASFLPASSLSRSYIYVCLRLLVVVLLPFLNLQAQIGNIFLSLIGIFSFFYLEYFPFSNQNIFLFLIGMVSFFYLEYFPFFIGIFSFF